MKPLCMALLVLLAVAGCRQMPAEPAAAEGTVLPPLPAHFAGTLPCADCPGIDYRLDLLPDDVFFLRESYQGREGGPFDDVGRYLLSSDGAQLSLHGGREASLRFSLVSPDELRLLDRRGRPIESELNYSLLRQTELELLEPRLLLRGMYRYMADAGRFRNCETGLDMPVASEGDNRALQSAYREARSEPGEPMLVSLEGQLAQRMPMEGAGPVTTLVPERFIGVWPDQNCPPLIERPELENTHWRLTLVESEAVHGAENQREPHLVFGGDNRLAGADGCNRLMGTYRKDRVSISIAGLASTRMACPEGMAEAEQFRQILEEVSRYRIIGRHLEMFDEDDTLRLRFEAGSPQ